MSERRLLRIRRVAVAVDSSPASLTAVEVAVELAEVGAGRVLGLFVEDQNLLRWAALPFARQVGSYSAALREVSGGELLRQLRLQAEVARRALVRAAERRGVPHEFRIARGAVVGEVLAALVETDLLILGKGGWAARGRAALGSTARAAVASARGRVLMLAPGSRLSGPVAVIYDGSAAGQAALATALELVREPEQQLTVICVGERRQACEEVAARARSTLETEGLGARFHHLRTSRVAGLPALAHHLGVNLLVAPAGSPALPADALAAVALAFPGPLLLVGETAEQEPRAAAGAPARG